MSTFVEYTGDGSTTSWAVPFDKIDQAVVKVNVDGLDVSATYDNGFVTLAEAPAADAKILVYRETPRDPLGTFEEGARLVEDNLNLLWEQCLDVAEEGFDSLTRENILNQLVVDGLQDALDNLPDLTPQGLLDSIKTVDGPASGLYSQFTDLATRASRLATARTISLTGEVTGSTSFDGSGNVSINTSIPNPPAELTAAEILAKLLTVDSNTTTLNANFLQGLAASDFIQKSQYSSSTSGDTGYIILPIGNINLKIIWGKVTLNTVGNHTITFADNGFPSKCLWATVGMQYQASAASQVLGWTKNYCTYWRSTGGGISMDHPYLAIGV